MKLKKEPGVDEIWEAMGDFSHYDEVVFCGFGEPTLRLDGIKKISAKLKEKLPKMKVRVNTDGLMNLRESRNAAAELKGLVDSFSVSLNAPDAVKYVEICPSKFGERAYGEVKQFIRVIKDLGFDVQATAVGLPGLDAEAVRKIVETELKVKFRLRKYQDVG